jgi:hypothetical protein
MVKFLLKQKVFNYFCVLYYAILFLFFFKVCFDFKYVIKYNISAGISRISKKITGKNLRNLEKNISRFIVLELEIFTNISNFLNLEILELFRYLKSSKCL